MQEMEVDNITDEDRFILKAKAYMSTDPCRSKSLIITAQTLFQNHFGVQYEAYKIEKLDGDVKKAAKYFSIIINTFKQPPPELWQEIAAITNALRCPKDSMKPEQEFLSDMFQNLTEDVQHKLLMLTADHSEDTLEHCRLLLLLIHKFPKTISTYGPSLVETLLTADRHGTWVGGWMELLLEEVTPLISASPTNMANIPPPLLYKMFTKSLEYYINKLYTKELIETSEANIIWAKIFGVLEMIGKQLSWEPYLITFDHTWSKETYYTKIMQRLYSKKVGPDDKRLLFCGAVLFLYCLYEYNNNMNCVYKGNVVKQTLIEYHKPFTTEHPARVPRIDTNDIEVTTEVGGKLKENSALEFAIKTWDMMHSSDAMIEFPKYISSLRIPDWLEKFLADMALYRGLHGDTMAALQASQTTWSQAARNIKLVSLYFKQKQYSHCFEHILLVVSNLPTYTGSLVNVKSTRAYPASRHLHFLPLTSTHIVQYCARILIYILKLKLQNLTDLGLGHLLVLMQIDRLQECTTYNTIFKIISDKRTFQYALFPKYITNITILEEVVYLSTVTDGVVFDIFPNSVQNLGRRIGTRHADKGVKEDFKQNMKAQLARHDEPVEHTIAQFISNERIQLLQCLL